MAYTYALIRIDQIRPHPNNARTHSKKQIRQIAASIRAVGFAAPVLVDEHNVLIAGRRAVCASCRLPPAALIDGTGAGGRLLLAALKFDFLKGEARCDMQGVAARERLPSADGDVDISGVDLQSVAPTSNPLCRQNCRARTAEAVENDLVAAGMHGRLEAAKSLGMSSIPAIVISGLSDAKKRALLLADNRIGQSAGWDRELLAIELATLLGIDTFAV
jgi:hypothetical protein